MDDMKLLSGVESYGGGGSFKGNVFIESEKYDALSKEMQNKISYKASDFLQTIRETISMEWAI